jgi:zinc transport system permease protein
VALGLIFAVSPNWTMPIFGLVVGLTIMAMQRRSSLSSDTVIGVIFAAVMAFGLAMVSRDRSVARDLQRFLYGDILTITDAEVASLTLLFTIVMVFQAWGYNRLLYSGLNPVVAQAHRVHVASYQYTFAGLLALVVMLSVWAVGVLLVTALLIVPAAAARNFARSAGAMFWWGMIVSVSSAIAGLLISAQAWARTATGPTVVLCGFAWFTVSYAVALARRRILK